LEGIVGTRRPRQDGLDAYRALGSKPEFEQLLREWSEYVAEAVMVHGEEIE
jgi:hypothetical protein